MLFSLQQIMINSVASSLRLDYINIIVIIIQVI